MGAVICFKFVEQIFRTKLGKFIKYFIICLRHHWSTAHAFFWRNTVIHWADICCLTRLLVLKHISVRLTSSIHHILKIWLEERNCYQEGDYWYNELTMSYDEFFHFSPQFFDKFHLSLCAYFSIDGWVNKSVSHGNNMSLQFCVSHWFNLCLRQFKGLDFLKNRIHKTGLWIIQTHCIIYLCYWGNHNSSAYEKWSLHFWALLTDVFSWKHFFVL